jgi:uroporphyrinogen-III decarboxylase
MLDLIQEGCVPLPALEGHWTTRLEVMADMPKGKILWLVDQSDMAKAKKTIGSVSCLAGNVPSDLLAVGSAEQVKGYVKNLVDTAGKGGGFILSNGAFFDQAKPENVHIMVDFTKEYGIYK